MHRQPVLKGTLCLAAALALAACGPVQSSTAATQPGGAATGGDPAAVTVVELFQSQGCSSCPPANANINAIARQQDVLVLSFAVTYWDKLGWKDIFASPQYTERLWDYARQAGRDKVYTPQVIINGGPAIVGNDRSKLDALIAGTGPARGGPALSVDGTVLVVAAQASPAPVPAAVWLVRYDPRSREVPIRAGENGGRTLPHRNIVRELTRLGEWTGERTRYALPAAREAGLLGAVMVQRGPGGPIIAAQKL